MLTCTCRTASKLATRPIQPATHCETIIGVIGPWRGQLVLVDYRTCITLGGARAAADATRVHGVSHGVATSGPWFSAVAPTAAISALGKVLLRTRDQICARRQQPSLRVCDFRKERRVRAWPSNWAKDFDLLQCHSSDDATAQQQKATQCYSDAYWWDGHLDAADKPTSG